jgi:hypothetical protein
MKKTKKRLSSLPLENLKENTSLFNNKAISGGSILSGANKNHLAGPCSITLTYYILPDGFGDKEIII